MTTFSRRVRIACVLPVALVGCQGGGPDVRNNLPAPTIVFPLDGDELVEGYPATLRGSVTDTNDPAEALLGSWLSGDTVVCEEAPIAADGSSVCEIVVASEDTALTFSVRDPDGADGAATVEVTTRPNAAPVVAISLPDGAGVYTEDAFVVFEARVSDAEDAPEDLALAWTDASGAVLDLDTTVDSHGGLSGALLLPAGTHAITLTATDSPGEAGSATVEIEVAAGG